MTSAGTPSRLLPDAPPEADRVHGVVPGAWTSQVAGTPARLAVPDLLADRSRTVDELPAELGVPATRSSVCSAWRPSRRS